MPPQMTPHAAPHVAPQVATHAERLETAVTTMLDELEAEQAREADLYCALMAARHRRAELARGARSMIRTLPAADRERHGKRLVLIERARRGPKRRRGGTGRNAELLAWLARHPSGEFTVAELDEAMAAAGFAREKQYSTKALYRLGRQGLVERTGWGRSRISHRHPELAALRRAAVAEAERGG